MQRNIPCKSNEVEQFDSFGACLFLHCSGTTSTNKLCSLICEAVKFVHYLDELISPHWILSGILRIPSSFITSVFWIIYDFLGIVYDLIFIKTWNFYCLLDDCCFSLVVYIYLGECSIIYIYVCMCVYMLIINVCVEFMNPRHLNPHCLRFHIPALVFVLLRPYVIFEACLIFHLEFWVSNLASLLLLNTQIFSWILDKFFQVDF